MRLSSLILLALLGATGAQAATMTPGLWEITTASQMQIPGMPKGMGAQPPSTFRHCYTAADVKDHQKAVPVSGNCKLVSIKTLPDGASWTVRCESPSGPMTGSGRITYTANAYTGSAVMTGKMQGAPFNMTQRYTGKRIGPCK